MIDVKEAVRIAKGLANDILDEPRSHLEEIEREDYKTRDVWSITLSVPTDTGALPPLQFLAAKPVQYKRFLIDATNGELVAIKLRELASQ